MRRLIAAGLLLVGIFCLSQQSDAYWQSRLQVSVGAATCTFTRIDFTTGSLGTASLSRSSSGTYINVSGILTTASTNAARFNYDANYPRGGAASLTGPFLLVEPVATNLFLQSNNYTTSWTIFTGATATAASGTSPDGTNDAWSQVIAAASFGAVGQSLLFTNATYSTSVWVKSNGANTAFTIGPLGFTSLFTATAAFVRDVSSIAITAGTIADFTVGANGAGAVGVLVFGSQVELGAVATSYIATATTTATRAADVVTFTQPAGCGHNTYTFDNNATQVVTQAAGSATVPTSLNRPNIKFIDGST